MILVTGATGMVGRAVVDRLLCEGIPVRAHARSKHKLEKVFSLNIGSPVPAERTNSCRTNCSSQEQRLKESLEAVVCDLSMMTLDQARELCRGCSTIVHTAALVHRPQSDPALYVAHNIRATELLSRAAEKSGVDQFIFLSSSAIYGNRPTNMVSEDAPLFADDAYSLSKISSERHLLTHGPARSTIVLRPALVFGEGDRGHMILLIRQIIRGKYFLVGNGTPLKSVIYAKDLAEAIMLAIKQRPSGASVFNIANPEPVSIRTLSEAILSAANKKTNIYSVPSLIAKAAAGGMGLILGERSPLTPQRLAKLIRNNSVSVSSFINQFNFKPGHQLKTALANEISWAQAEQLL